VKKKSSVRADYCDGEDSHLNQLANETVGPVFADAVMAAARNYAALISSTLQ